MTGTVYSVLDFLMNPGVPQPGDTIYVPEGDDEDPDFAGGLATVTRVVHGTGARQDVAFVSVHERPEWWARNWHQVLAGEQGTLRIRFGFQIASFDPDRDLARGAW